MRPLLFVPLLVLSLAACGSAPDRPSPTATTVTGVVVGAPCRPVERAGEPPCPPAAGVSVVFGSASTTTDAAGRYSIALPAGTYRVLVQAGAWRRPAQPGTVTVSGEGALTLDLAYDTGIR